MTNARGKTVALIDPVWAGHHPMYFCQFAASFLRRGARVIGLCPDPQAAISGLARAVDETTAAQLAGLAHFALLPSGKRSFFNGRFEGDPVRTFARWRRAADSLADAEAASGFAADLVYFPCLDSYLRFLPFPVVPDALLHRPWSGLYLRTHHHGEGPSLLKLVRMLAKGDHLLRGKFCRGIGVLDERFIPALEKLTGKDVIAYPDVTDATLPAEPFPLAMEVERKAAGRKIIGLIGLERRKGFLVLLRAAALARQRNLPYYFVCAGAIQPGEYSDAEQKEIEAALCGIDSGEIQNLHFDPAAGRIREEADFNVLFSRFAIAWCVYDGFQGSSGTLSKAAAFEIPCLATAGECVGRRVETYRLGLTIPAPTPELALDAIPRLLARAGNDGQPLAPRFAEYRERHSQKRLDQILGGLLASV